MKDREFYFVTHFTINDLECLLNKDLALDSVCCLYHIYYDFSEDQITFYENFVLSG